MRGTLMRPHPALLLIVLTSGVLFCACGTAGFGASDAVSPAEAAAAPARSQADVATTVEPTASETVTAAPASEVATTTVAVASAGDNRAAWLGVDSAAQTFAGHLDEATQSIASCQTDAAAGANFGTCIGKAFTAIAAAGTELVATLDAGMAKSTGACWDALGAMRTATKTMSDDYQSAVSIQDLTSLETAYAQIGNDAGAYADAAMLAASSCSTG